MCGFFALQGGWLLCPAQALFSPNCSPWLVVDFGFFAWLAWVKMNVSSTLGSLVYYLTKTSALLLLSHERQSSANFHELRPTRVLGPGSSTSVLLKIPFSPLLCFPYFCPKIVSARALLRGQVIATSLDFLGDPERPRMETGLTLYSWGVAFWRKYGNKPLEVLDTNPSLMPQYLLNIWKSTLGL